MNKIKSFVVMTRYNENFDWIENYTDEYIIYNKGTPIYDNPKVLNVPNQGKNARDIPYYAYNNDYNSMPDLIAFIQAIPYDHCSKPIFEKLIYGDKFTVIDDPLILGTSPSYMVLDDMFAEYNSRQPIGNHWNPPSRYASFDALMYKYFEDYDSPDWVKFSKGIQYIVEKEQLVYPKKFWKSLMDDLPYNDMMEGHFIERAMWYILTHAYTLKEEYYD